MSLIVKIMCATRGNDGHPRHGHRILADVQEVNFIEPTHARGPQVEVCFRRATDATPPERQVFALYGNVYVMNEGGKTITSFEVSGAPELGMPETAYVSWADIHKDEDPPHQPPA